VLDAGLVGVVAFHGLNGARLILLDFAVGLRFQKALFWASFVIAAAVFVAMVVAARNLL
jgi:succinate dehydrogenase/fumarate reductase cytochrome b subunit